VLATFPAARIDSGGEWGWAGRFLVCSFAANLSGLVTGLIAIRLTSPRNGLRTGRGFAVSAVGLASAYFALALLLVWAVATTDFSS
jgi:hypothetical protein